MSETLFKVTSAIPTPEMLWERAVEEAKRGYRKMVDTNRIIESVNVLHKRPYCDIWSDVVARLVRSEVQLFDRSAQFNIVEWTPSTRELCDSANVQFHRFIVAKIDGLDERVLDGTWQQFIPDSMQSTELPQILQGTRNEVIDLAYTVGIPESLLDIWRATAAPSY